MMNINILVEHMGSCQLSYYLIRNVNKICDERNDIDCIAYYNTLVPPCIVPKFALMQMVEAWNQPGHTIATSLSTSRRMLGFSGVQKKLYYYVWDLEWTHGDMRKYDFYKDVFTHPNIVIIARSITHSFAIENCFNRKKIYIMDDFNSDQLLEIIEREDSNTRDCAA